MNWEYTASMLIILSKDQAILYMFVWNAQFSFIVFAF